MHVSTLYGPHRITRVRQIAVPADLLRAWGLEVGDYVHFRLSDSDPAVLEVIPTDIVVKRYESGTKVEALEHLDESATLDDADRGFANQALSRKTQD